MRRCVLWVVMVFIAAATLAAQKKQDLKSVAVIKFENRSVYPENDWIGLGFAESVTAKLGFVDGLAVMERAKLNEVLAAAGKEDVLNETQQLNGEEYARITGVEYLLIGSVQATGVYQNASTQLKINARIIRTATAEIVKEMTFGVSGPISDIFDLQMQLASKFCDALGSPAGLSELRFEDAQSMEAQRLYSEGLRSYYISDFTRAIGLFRAAVDRNEGVFYAAAHTMEGLARQKQIEKAQNADRRQLKEQYLMQFRKDASEAAPAFYDLGIAQQAVGDQNEAIRNFHSFLTYMDRTRQFVIPNPFKDEDLKTESGNDALVFETDKGLRISSAEGQELLYYADPEINSDAKFLTRQDTLFVLSNSVFAFTLKPVRFLWKYQQNLNFDFTIIKDGSYLYAVNFDHMTILDAATGLRVAYWSMPPLSDLNYIKIEHGVFWSGLDTVAYNLNVLFSNRTLHSETDALFQIGRCHALSQNTDSALYYYDRVLAVRRDHLDAMDAKSATLQKIGRIEEAATCALEAISYGAMCQSREVLYQINGISGYMSLPGWISHVETYDSVAYVGLGTPGFVGKSFSKIYSVDLLYMKTSWSYDFQIGSYMPTFCVNSRSLFTYKPVNNQYTLVTLARTNGQVVWQKDLNTPYFSSEYYDEFIRPAATDNVVMAAVGSVYGLNASTGKEIWQRHQIGSFDENPDAWIMPEGEDETNFDVQYIGGAPVAANRRFFVSTPKNLLCLGEDGNTIWSQASGHHKLSLRIENEMVSVQDFMGSETSKRYYDQKSGHMLKATPDREFHRVHTDETHSIFDGKSVYTLEATDTGVVVHKVNTNSTVDSKPIRMNNYSADLGAKPVFINGDVWILFGYLNQDGANYGGVAVLDALTLRLKWKLDVSKNVVHASSSGNTYYLFTSRGDIIRIERKKIEELLTSNKKWWND